jgi:uncharacterized protein YciI
MSLFAVIGFDHPPHSMELREKFRAEHRAYAKANDETTRLAGAFYDVEGNQCGTLKIFEAESAEEVWEWYRKEPFYNNNVYKDFHVIEWRMALNLLQPTGGWDANYPTKADVK